MLALPATAATVRVRIAFQLDGSLTELQAQVKQGSVIQNKINPGVGRELWANVIHGPNVNSAVESQPQGDDQHVGTDACGR